MPTDIPAQARYMPMILDALRVLGGSAKAASVKDAVATKLADLGENIPTETLKSGAQRFPNDLQWGRFYLINAGYIEPKAVSGHGIWKLTGLGWSTVMTTEQAITALAGQPPQAEQPPDADPQASLPGTVDFRKQLFDILKSLTPLGFERLCREVMACTGPLKDASAPAFRKVVDGLMLVSL